jgi:hypothetical protein
VSVGIRIFAEEENLGRSVYGREEVERKVQLRRPCLMMYSMMMNDPFLITCLPYLTFQCCDCDLI